MRKLKIAAFMPHPDDTEILVGGTLLKYKAQGHDVHVVIAMDGRCPKCGGRIMKRTGNSKKTGKQYTYYCCEHVNSRDEANKCDFMTWDVPVKDDCPVCGHTMFKKAGKGFKKPFCINPECPNFLPEDKRGYPKKPAAESAAETAETDETAEGTDEQGEKTAVKKAAAKKPAAKKTAAKAASKSTSKAAAKTASKTTAKKKTTVKTKKSAEED